MIQASLGATEQTLDKPEPDVTTLDPPATWPYPPSGQEELVLLLRRLLAQLEGG